ncbi:MAG: hypothetical protein B7Y45_11345 [Sphingomonas sp. 28-66-16]|nr:MAG: hypothetical protein B7Y45_11345 [Sphingomonas sp. 28-66-16]
MLAGATIDVVAIESTRWASATFVGARHLLSLVGRDDPDLARWLGDLPDADIDLCGHLVADLAIGSIARLDGQARAELEILTLERS